MTPDDVAAAGDGERTVTADEAHASLTRFISSHFNRPHDPNLGAQARFSIPVQQDDDDVVLARFIDQYAALERRAALLPALVEALADEVGSAHKLCGHEGSVETCIDFVCVERRALLAAAKKEME